MGFYDYYQKVADYKQRGKNTEAIEKHNLDMHLACFWLPVRKIGVCVGS